MDLNTVILVIGMLFIHWVADFVLQTDKQAKGKSKNWGDLIEHTWTYSMVWMAVGIFYILFHLDTYEQWDLTCFVLITFVFHTITDYFTSRLNSKLWGEGKVHNFFVSVGFDQWLHYVQLFLTFYLLTNS